VEVPHRLGASTTFRSRPGRGTSVKWLDTRDIRSAGITGPTGWEFRGPFPGVTVGVGAGLPAENDTNMLSIGLVPGRWTAQFCAVCLSPRRRPEHRILIVSARTSGPNGAGPRGQFGHTSRQVKMAW